MIAVADLADELNQLAASLAPELLPNGHKSGTKWMTSGIDDTGKSASLAVTLSGPKVGHWADYGNARGGEDKGDMLDLLRLVRCGGDMRAAIDEAKRLLGKADDWKPGRPPAMSPAEREARAAAARARAEAREAEEAAQREARMKRARGLWLSGKPISGTPAEAYLAGRGLDCAPGQDWPGALRFHAEVWHKDAGVKMPAMLAAIYNAAGEQTGCHRTYLQASPAGWIKASGKAKLVLGTMWGGFVPIAKGASGKPMAAMAEDEPVYVTEGIEDAICVRMMKPGARVVAAISLGNIGAIVLPAKARRLVIVADRDENEAAQEQLARAIAQQQARGLEVQLVMPPVPHKDINDWWLALCRPERRRA